MIKIKKTKLKNKQKMFHATECVNVYAAFQQCNVYVACDISRN